MSDLDQISRAIGELQGQHTALQSQLANIQKEVIDIRHEQHVMNKLLSEMRGGWKGLMIAGGTGGGLAAAIIKAIAYLKGLG